VLTHRNNVPLNILLLLSLSGVTYLIISHLQDVVHAIQRGQEVVQVVAQTLQRSDLPVVAAFLYERRAHGFDYFGTVTCRAWKKIQINYSRRHWQTFFFFILSSPQT